MNWDMNFERVPFDRLVICIKTCPLSSFRFSQIYFAVFNCE